ncbi:MAG: hotdog fold thioesterase [Candidatus Bathyarchaeota archaeon]|nr:hotdog fold thioesterase [Candidatus Bathyarchaeota archaeon]
MNRQDCFRELLGIKVLEVKEGYSRVSLKVAREHTNFLGATHGGAIFTLADCAFAEAVNFGDTRAMAVQVSINFLRPSSEGDVLMAEASKVSEGKTFALYNITISREGKLVALFSGLAYKLPAEK